MTLLVWPGVTIFFLSPWLNNTQSDSSLKQAELYLSHSHRDLVLKVCVPRYVVGDLYGHFKLDMTGFKGPVHTDVTQLVWVCCLYPPSIAVTSLLSSYYNIKVITWHWLL